MHGIFFSVLLPAYQFYNEDAALSLSINVAQRWMNLFQTEYFDHDIIDGIDTAIKDETTMAWYDMSVGQRIPRQAFLLDIVARQEGQDDLFCDLFRSMIFQMEMLSQDRFWMGHNNHGLYQSLGQLAAARRFKFLAGFDKYFDLAQQRTSTILRKQFFTSGVHTEHSPAYHKMVLRSVLGALHSGLIEDQSLAELLEQSEDALRWMVTPDGSLSTFGDTDYTQDKEFENVRPLGLKAYKDAGYVFARKANEQGSSHDSYFAQMAAFHSRTHKHADHLSLIWHENGKRILIDPGRYGYGPKTVLGDELSMAGHYYSDPNRRYVESTRAHNCVEIDGVDHKRKGAKPFGSALLFAEEMQGLWLTLCEVRHRHVRHFRLVIISPGDFLLVMDWLKDGTGAEHDYRQWFQLAPEWALSGADGILSASCHDTKLKVVSLISNTTLGDIYSGTTDPMQGWHSPKAGVLEPSTSFNFHTRGNTARFATLFSLSDHINIDSLKLNEILSKGELSWRNNENRYRLIFKRYDTKLNASLKKSSGLNNYLKSWYM